MQVTKPAGDTVSIAPEVRLSPVDKPAAVRRLGPVDATGLAAQVARLSDRAWQREDGVKENRYSCFHSSRCRPTRGR